MENLKEDFLFYLFDVRFISNESLTSAVIYTIHTEIFNGVYNGYNFYLN